MKMTTKNVEDTEALGERIGRLVAHETVKPILLLIGDLGAGKTALTRGIARGIGAEGPVQSPTFTFVREYFAKEKRLGAEGEEPCRDENLRLVHVDLYRLNDVESIADLGLDDFLHGDVCVAIEWGERARAVIPRRHLEIRIEHLGPEKRGFSFFPEDDAFWNALSSNESSGSGC